MKDSPAKSAGMGRGQLPPQVIIPQKTAFPRNLFVTGTRDFGVRLFSTVDGNPRLAKCLLDLSGYRSRQPVAGHPLAGGDSIPVMADDDNVVIFELVARHVAHRIDLSDLRSVNPSRRAATE